jgi:hypothetical protein
VPDDMGIIRANCPLCNQQFFYEPAHPTADSRAIHKANPRPPKRQVRKFAAISLVVILLAAVLGYFYFTNRSEEAQGLKKNAEWIVIDYADLLDDNLIIRTGQPLKSSIADPDLRGAIQPFVDKYSFLLQYAIEMIIGPDDLPQYSVVDCFPEGSRQPAWVAILRGGRIFISTDYQKMARVFLLGDDPEKAYKNNYGVIRHCLSGLLSDDGSELKVMVYSYRNKYAESKIELNLVPYIVETSSFKSFGQVPLDLDGFSAFFEKGGKLEGALLDQKDGLVLFASEGPRETIAGSGIELSDFAVAYRSVFHAGDNEAFISLDPHIDPTKVTVNFGGFLEDTRIGSVVLESDKRFKTITCGLDPNSFGDMKNYMRKFMPAFLTANEREFLDGGITSNKGWIGTRFWFYPDSVEVESDLDFRYARIVKPQFTADAERSREDFSSPDEFELKKRATLLPSIRECIDHLNQNYSKYSEAYQEIRELTTVARLMGLCSWLRRANVHGIDLDALLSVEVPPLRTERERTQLLTATQISYVEGEHISEEYVRRNSKVINLSPILDKPIRRYFLTSKNIAKFFCYKNHLDEEFYTRFESEANRIYVNNGDDSVRTIIKNKEDFQALASYASSNLKAPEPETIANYEQNLHKYKKELDRLEREIDQLKNRLKNANSIGEHNFYINQYNDRINKYELLRQTHNYLVDEFNKRNAISTPVLTRISGGINLESKYFKIRNVPESPALRNLAEIAKRVEISWKEIPGSGKWIKSRTSVGLPYKNNIPKYKWVSKAIFQSGNYDFKYISAGSKLNYWKSVSRNSGFWRDLIEFKNGQLREKIFDNNNKLIHITEYGPSIQKAGIIGEILGDSRIVFHKMNRKNISKLTAPPEWWENNKE